MSFWQANPLSAEHDPHALVPVPVLVSLVELPHPGSFNYSLRDFQFHSVEALPEYRPLPTHHSPPPCSTPSPVGMHPSGVPYLLPAMSRSPWRSFGLSLRRRCP